MLRLRHGNLLPEETPESLAEFLGNLWTSSDDSDSTHRYMVLTETDGMLHYAEGYISRSHGGELQIRANRISYARQLHLYAWQNVIAMMPCNKSIKRCWLHPDIETLKDSVDYRHSYYRSMYKPRIEQCIVNSQRT